MERIGITELKNGLSSLIERVSKGARFIITDHNRPVAKLSPVDHGESVTAEEQLAALIASGRVECSKPFERLEAIEKVRIEGTSASAQLVSMRR